MAGKDEIITPGPSVGRRALRFARNVDWGAYGVVVATVAIWLVFNAATSGLFLSPRNLTVLMIQGAVLAIVASGMVLVMVAGQIDLSLASSVGLSATIAAYLQVIHGWETLPTIAAVVLAGLLMGIWQGAWIAYVGIPAFIVTLAGMSLFRGAAYLLSNGQTYAPMTASFETIAGASLSRPLTLALLALAAAAYMVITARGLRRRAGGRGARSAGAAVMAGLPVLIVLVLLGAVSLSYRGLPYPVLIVAAVAIVLAFVARRTRFGRHLYGIGGNREAALLAGINVRRHIFIIFMGMGLLYAIAGIVLVSRVNGAPADPALFLELDAITACIIGGTSLFGGVGTVQGAILGALLLTSLNNGMDLMGISTYIQFVVKGLVLLLAVLLDVSLKRRRAG